MKALGGRLSAFIVFEFLGTLIKHDARVFEIASQSPTRNKRKWKYYEELYCYGDLPFQKGCHQCYHNAVDDYKIKG